MIPNISMLEQHLNTFCTMGDADEVVLFERATFLVIAHAQAADVPMDVQLQAQERASALQQQQTKADHSITDATTKSSGAAAAAGGEDGGELNNMERSSSIAAAAVGDASASSPPAAAAASELQSGGGQRGGEYSDDAMPVHMKRTPHFDAHRFEKISNIVKQFKLSCTAVTK